MEEIDMEINKNNFKEIIENNETVIIDFWAPWCGPCRALGPMIEEISENHEDVYFGKVNVDNEEELDQNETKTQLLNKAKDAMDRSLDASNEFQQILAKIKKLSQTTDYDTWVVNKEGNTATLNSKKARIFKQNNNLCLSHEGKIELFKSVAELHDWLKENNYPLPKNIEIHESTELKEGFDLYSKYKEYISQEKSNVNTEYENREKNKLSPDEIKAYRAELKNDGELFQQEISPLQLKLDDLMSQYKELPLKHKVYSKIPKEIRELEQQIDKIRQKYRSKKNIRDITADNVPYGNIRAPLRRRNDRRCQFRRTGTKRNDSKPNNQLRYV
jgi:thiol-disulfide isomerase/thioredoxin